MNIGAGPQRHGSSSFSLRRRGTVKKNVDEEKEENDGDDGNEDEDDDNDDEDNDATSSLLAIFETTITLCGRLGEDEVKWKVATIIAVKWRRVDTPPYDTLASSDHYRIKRPGM